MPGEPLGKRKRSDEEDTPRRQRSRPVCAICLEALNEDEPRAACGHSFHESCITAWRSRRQGHRCPLCRMSLDTGAECSPRSMSEWFYDRTRSSEFGSCMRRIMETVGEGDGEPITVDQAITISDIIQSLFGDDMSVNVYIDRARKGILLELPYEDD